MSRENPHATDRPPTLAPFTHDCDKCQWVGWLSGYGGEMGMANVYAHRDGDRVTVVIRYGSEGPQYWSATTGGSPHPVQLG